MVHVASAGGGRHKMLAFESAEPLLRPVDTTSIITVNTIETSSNSSSSSPSPSPSNASVEPVVIVSEVHSRELHIIAEEPTTGNSSPTLLIGQKKNHNNHSSNVGNGIVTQQQQGKMNQNRDGSNGNANFLADTFNSNHNSNMNKQSVKPDGLALISHGLTDSVCESLKLLDNENENVEEGENKVFTEEVVITTIVKKAKTGIMKTTTSHTSSTTTKSEEWHKHDYIMEEGSLNESNDADDLPLLPSGNSSCEAVSSIPTNQFGADPADSSNTGQVAKLSKLGNGSKQVGLKRVSFGSSKTGLVETLVYETPTQEESQNGSAIGGGLGNNDETKAVSINDDDKSGNDAVGGSTGGSRPPSRVRVTFFESEKPLAVSSPESDILDFDLSNMTLPGSPNAVDHPPNYNRQMSEGWDNPFRPDGDLSKEADQIVELIKEGKPINEENLRSKSPSVNESFNVSHNNQLNASPRKEANGTTVNGSGGPPDTVQHGVVQAGQAAQVEHVVLKKKKGCCVIQ